MKLFRTKDLTYDSLLKEWNHHELVIFFVKEINKGWGHSIFLWGIETDKNKPRIAVIDPLVHPNTNHKIKDQNTNSKGTFTWSDISIGTMSVNNKTLPDWRIKLENKEYTYTIDNLTETFEEENFEYQILGFVSVSDVSPIPEPTSILLCGVGLAYIIIWQKKKQIFVN